MKLAGKLEIIERQPVRVACLRYTGPGGEPLRRFWRATVAPWLADNGLLDCPRYGVAIDGRLQTAPEQCRYDACVELPPGLSLPGAPETIIAGGRYAYTRFKGTGEQLDEAWSAFTREFLAGYRLDDRRPPFEHYPRGATCDVRSGVFVGELCLPVAS
jgi:AraC family transcriptional regulator